MPRDPAGWARTLCRVLAMLTLALGTRTAGAQLSPGPLARAHRELEGASNCAKCHGLRREPMQQLCLECHKEVGALLQQRRGYHGREARTSGKTCAQCHPDHAGEGFSLIEWPGGAQARFDHATAGWPLRGAHTEVKCATCHATTYRTSPVAALSPRKGSAGWVGLDDRCASCHTNDDVHQGKLDARCETCHDERAWAPAPRFDHDRSEYPLTGEHADVACDKCHLTPRLPSRVLADGKRVGTFKPVPFRECSTCHADPHKGALGAKCGSCHVTRGFDVIDQKGFNHQATRYPLRGRHSSATCEGCHGANLANRKPGFATCGGCHADPHPERTSTGTATAASDCSSCHGLSGFAPSTFTVAQHATTRYPLDGRHRDVTCGRCHQPVAPAPRARTREGRTPARIARLRPAATTCATCHADAHGRDLVTSTAPGTCETCHATSGFTPSTYTREAHARLRVGLDGRHGAVACAACHGPTRPGLPPLAVPAGRTARLTLRVPEVTCSGCHVDPHAGRYDGKGPKGTATTCTGCHDAARWRPATTTPTTHASLGYALEGAHLAVPCVSCHEEMRGRPATATLKLAARGVATLTFGTPRATTCLTCHANPHGTQFAQRRDGGSCEGCHTVASFAPAQRFDHERDATFSLKGAHAAVPCASCHRAPSPGAPVAWRPLSGACESCHTRVPARRDR